jgi:uncharacterized protein (TIGR00730 family)
VSAERPPEDEAPRPPHTLDEELLEAETAAVASTLTDADRIERVRAELRAAFDALAHIGPAVSIFGSARTSPGAPAYELARTTARLLGEAGFPIITGGGPGIMEAGNRGASEAGVTSIGLDIDLLLEEGLNEYVDLPLRFHYFFVRKVVFVRYASAFVVFPGGFGTLDELFEAATLIQTEKIHSFPLVLVGCDYWQGMLDWLRSTVIPAGNVWADELGLLRLTDDPEEVVSIVRGADHRKPRSE